MSYSFIHDHQLINLAKKKTCITSEIEGLNAGQDDQIAHHVNKNDYEIIITLSESSIKI